MGTIKQIARATGPHTHTHKSEYKAQSESGGIAYIYTYNTRRGKVSEVGIQV